MVYFRVSALGLTAAAVLTTFLVLPGLARRDQGPSQELVRAYATHRRVLVETRVIAGVKVDGGRLLVTPGPRWGDLSDEVRHLHARVLAEGLLGSRGAPYVIGAP